MMMADPRWRRRGAALLLRVILVVNIASTTCWLASPLCRAYARSDFGRDALCGAAYYGRIWEIRLLLSWGADPNRVGWEDHFTPLSNTVLGGQVEAAHLLLASGADPNAPNDPNFGETAISVQGSYGADPVDQARVVEVLRRAGGH